MTQANGNEEIVLSRENLEQAPEEPFVEEVHHYHHADDDDGRHYYSSFKLDRIVWLVAIVLEILIGFRVFLKVIAANPASGFASFIYAVTAPFLVPFAGLTSTPSANGAVLEISSIIAMAVYALLFWLALYVIHLFSSR